MAELDRTGTELASMPGPLVMRTLLGCLAGLVVVQTVKLGHFGGAGLPKVLTDFDAFHIVGRMALRGELDRAYAFETMRSAQLAASGTDSFMPWTYPPPFDLVVAPLGLLPIWLAYLVFTGATLAAFLGILKRLAGEAFGAALLATAPALIVAVICGQNGFLTGTLAGWAGLALLRRGAASGLPLGLMAIKPHLALGLGLYTLILRRWSALAVAAAVVAGLCGLASAVFGLSVWDAFRGGLGEARIFLEAGFYPLFRMISVYAFLLTVGVPAKAALCVQLAVAAAALAGVVLARREGRTARQVLGFALLAGLVVSPYAYDYDLPIATLGLALLLPDLVRLTSVRERVLLLVLNWIACGWGLAQTHALALAYGSSGIEDLPDATHPLSLGGAVFLLLLVVIRQILARESRTATEPGLPAAFGQAPA